MAVTRTWSWIVLAGAGALLLAACSDSEPEQAPPPAAQAPAAPAPAGQPPAAAPGQPAAGLPQGAPAGATAQAMIEELYVDSEAEPDEGEPPLTVKFATTVEDQTGAFECEWDFGDGSPKEKGVSPTHVYKTEDDFVATVVCKDSKGITGETEVDVTVYKYE